MGSATAEEHEVISDDFLSVTKSSLDFPTGHQVEMELRSCAFSPQVKFPFSFISENLDVASPHVLTGG